MNNLEVLILLLIIVFLLARLLYSTSRVSFIEGVIVVVAIALTMGKLLMSMKLPLENREGFMDGTTELTGFPDPSNMTVFLNCLDDKSFSGSTEWRNVAPLSTVKDPFMFEMSPEQSNTDRGINMKGNSIKGVYSDRLGIDNNKILKPFTLFWYMRFNALTDTPTTSNGDPTIPILQIFAQSPDINAVRVGYQVVTSDVTRYRLVVKYGNKPDRVYENNLAQDIFQFNDQQPHLFVLVRTSSHLHLYVDKLGDLFKGEFKIDDTEPIVLTNREMEVNRQKLLNAQMYMLGIYRKDLSKGDVDVLNNAIEQVIVKTNPIYKTLHSDYKQLQKSVDAKKQCPFSNKGTCDNCSPTLDWTDANHVFNTAGDICKKDVREYCKGVGQKEIPCVMWKALEDEKRACLTQQVAGQAVSPTGMAIGVTPASQLSIARSGPLPVPIMEKLNLSDQTLVASLVRNGSVSNSQVQVLAETLSTKPNLNEAEKRRLVLDLVRTSTGLEAEALRIVGRELLEAEAESVLRTVGLNNTTRSGQQTNMDRGTGGGAGSATDSGGKDADYDKIIAMYRQEQLEKAQKTQDMGFFRRLMYNLLGV